MDASRNASPTRLVAPLFLLALAAGCTSGGGFSPIVRQDGATGTPDMAVGPGCLNGTKDGDETDTDCGGTCSTCELGKLCSANKDCQSANCMGGRCLPAVGPTCFDGAKNGNETDQDCGGGSCAGCANGQSCVVNSDCLSNRCQGNQCASPSSCMDGTKNGNETDRDCGGGACPKCANGKTCGMDTDCTSGLCSDGVCAQPPANCTDGSMNGNETDQDCGGGACPQCGLGKHCNLNTDCTTFNCVGGVCAPPATCSDGVKNGNESDRDCGGGTCQDCADGKHCNLNSDCANGVCNANGICGAVGPTCNDGMQNGTESDTDCGGSCATKCGNGQSCNANTDCQSNLTCTFGTCQAQMSYACWDAATCYSNCADQTCANQCAMMITTANGFTLLVALFDCFEATCPSSGGGVCDSSSPTYNANNCNNCYSASQAGGGACVGDLNACLNDS